MIKRRTPHTLQAWALALVALSAAACHREKPKTPPVATPSVKLSRDRAPLGSPLDITYRFDVAPDAPPFAEDYTVFVGVVDADGELLWTEDHQPPIPTKQWKPGQTIEYTRTIFVPVYPYIGEAAVRMGLYSMATKKRLTLAGQDAGQQAYKVATIQLQPQSDNLFTVFKSGWHPAEAAEHNPNIEWQWTKKQATLAFKNPHKACTFFLELDNPGGVFNESQQVQVTLGDAVLAEIAIAPGQLKLHRIPVSTVQLGSADMAELQITVDKTFVPKDITSGASKDPRELGVRVFHAFIEPTP
ncbi:MAG: hypothetical protein ABUS56_10200 [Acidobacteriota bacterium]